MDNVRHCFMFQLEVDEVHWWPIPLFLDADHPNMCNVQPFHAQFMFHLERLRKIKNCAHCASLRTDPCKVFEGLCKGQFPEGQKLNTSQALNKVRDSQINCKMLAYQRIRTNYAHWPAAVFSFSFEGIQPRGKSWHPIKKFQQLCLDFAFKTFLKLS